jgi:hypothetical protein
VVQCSSLSGSKPPLHPTWRWSLPDPSSRRPAHLSSGG